MLSEINHVIALLLSRSTEARRNKRAARLQWSRAFRDQEWEPTTVDFESFKESLVAKEPPADISLALQALWHAAKGDWHGAHERAQAQEDRDGAWVHAYLHRQEGDDANAAYWYRRAGKPVALESLEEEWESIAQSLCANSS
jgi:hypothetical protein